MQCPGDIKFGPICGLFFTVWSIVVGIFKPWILGSLEVKYQRWVINSAKYWCLTFVQNRFSDLVKLGLSLQPSGMTSFPEGSLSIRLYERLSLTYFIHNGLWVRKFISCFWIDTIASSLRHMHTENRGMLGTTVLCVRKDKKVIIIGDGQVTLGNEIIKPNVRKVRRLGANVIGGFAGQLMLC